MNQIKHAACALRLSHAIRELLNWDVSICIMRAVPRLGYYRRPVVLNVEKGLLTLQKRREQRQLKKIQT